MVILDATITNVALPSIQRDLGFTPADLQWVVNGYTLTFGGFLLLGGRMGDLVGLAQQLIKRFDVRHIAVGGARWRARARRARDPGRGQDGERPRRARLPPTPADQPAALVDGFQVAFTGASLLLAGAAIVLALTLRASDTANINPEEAPVVGA